MPVKTGREGLLSSGILLIAGALVCGAAAWLHVRSLAQAYGVICGADAGGLTHCPACYGSVLLFAAGAAALSQARSPLAPVRSMSSLPA